jgi:hypothetical protein
MKNLIKHPANKLNLRILLLAALFSALFSNVTASLAKNYIYTPDHRIVPVKGGVTQPDLSDYRSPIQSKVIDRRFYTNDATYMANEGFKTGMEGFTDMVSASFPVTYKRAFQWVVAREMYFYSRYLLDYIGGRTHAGLHMVQGPYWTLKAQQHSAFNRLRRDRGEVAFSNKDVMLGFYLPLVYQRTGFPRVFEGIQPTYLQYKSVDPHFVRELDKRDSFADAMSGKKGGWGIAKTFFDDHSQRLSHDKMDTTFDLGAMGQFVKRRSQWLDRFYQAQHQGTTRISNGKKVPLLGNDAEEGMRGWGLTMSAVNEILQVKSAMFSDGKRLLGINPANYDPANGLRYLPHEIKPNILWVGDLPERLWSMQLKDASSQLWDQASWIWGASAFAIAANRRGKMFTDNPPVDGGLVEKSTGLVAEALANAIVKNVVAMHTEQGILLSRWSPEKGKGKFIDIKDLTMAMVALHDIQSSWSGINRHGDIVKQAKGLLKSNGDFLLKVQSKDGSFNSRYALNGQPLGKEGVGAAHWGAIRALLAAYYALRDHDYLRAARNTYNRLNRHYWVAKAGVYKSQLNSDLVTITPYQIGLINGALRELMFTTPSYLLEPQIEQMTRWWVQSVNQSGLLLSEHQSTGEIFAGFGNGDDDADGIPHVSKADGEFGAAPLVAAKVVINVGKGDNQAFAALTGDLHLGDRLSVVRMNYQNKPLDASPILSLDNPVVAGLVTRKDYRRGDGTVIPLAPSKPIKVGIGTVKGFSGQQIYEANCMICHGQHGEGIDGKPLDTYMKLPHVAMAAFVKDGNPSASMPAWGIGNKDDVGGILTDLEIDKVVSYVQSEPFKTN